MEGGGTEAFPELGRHCNHSDCKQLDFLPFTCDSCCKVFCLDHRSYKTHDCPKSNVSSRKVVVCKICSMSIETTGLAGEDEKSMLQKHEKSGDCDPKKKKMPTCPVRRCREVLTFSNTSTCKACQVKVCLKHRFPADHACKPSPPVSVAVNANDLLPAFKSMNFKDCGGKRPIPEARKPRTVKTFYLDPFSGTGYR